MPKRQPINTATAAVQVMAAATREIVPPAHVRLQEDDWPFWHSVIAEFARSEWTQHQLELAALLARCMADMEREQYELRDEGSVVRTEKGTPVVNPRKSVVQMHAGTILSMRRSLALHARAQAGDNREAGKRREIARDIESGNPLDDDLLARPSIQ